MRKFLLFAAIAASLSVNSQVVTSGYVPGTFKSLQETTNHIMIKAPVGRVYGNWSEWAFELECSENASLLASYAVNAGLLAATGAYSFQTEEDWRYAGDVHIEYRCRQSWMPGPVLTDSKK